jgi:tetraacyldisaccharide 4'-kinase
MSKRITKKHWLLAPLTLLYRVITGVRNKLFDWKILSSEEFDLPIISVGNLTVGGTGKTPHTEYLINLLKNKRNIAVLSRGYKRKSKGFRLATPDSNSKEIGDEPYQIKAKHPDIHVAVDSDRRHGIHLLCENSTAKDVEVIILDDAFQHRYIVPGINIVLMDYNRPIYEDMLMPTGMLREPISSLHRAHIVIVTKCPQDIKPIDFRIVAKNLDLRPYQQLFFTTFKYGDLRRFATPNEQRRLSSLTPDTHILLVTGIASADSLIKNLREHTDNIIHMEYDDHHDFNQKELKDIKKRFESINAVDKFILTTEKDAARLSTHDLDGVINDNLYIQPIEVEFLQGQQEIFNNYITDYVNKNSRNRIVH